MFKPYAHLAVAALITIIGFVPHATAQITPSHVFQVVDNLNNELDILLDFNFVDPATIQTPAQLLNRNPKHVIYRARQVILKANELRWLSGFSQQELAPVPVKKIVPADVFGYVQDALTLVKEMRIALGAEAPEAAPLPNGYTPTHVFNHLSLAMKKIIALDTPNVVPNDVYRQAQALYGDVQLLRKHAGLSADVPNKIFKGKLPPHVYERAVDLSVFVTQFDGGKTAADTKIRADLKITGKIGPEEVQTILSIALADILTLKTKKGIKTPTALPKVAVGRTPSDVYEFVDRAYRGLEDMKKTLNEPKPKPAAIPTASLTPLPTPITALTVGELL